MVFIQSTALSLADFLEQYADDPRYELIDGELRDLEPTGPHESVSGKVAGYLFSEILRRREGWTVPKTCLVQPPDSEATALRPDVVVLDESALAAEPLWEREPIITSGQPIVMVAEVVSTNWQDDYARKVEEYALLGIEEYWIVDFRGLGGVQFIGRPKQPSFTVCQLSGQDYERQIYRLEDRILSRRFPEIQLRLDALMP
jgi:Uma2 family endonuclease